MQVRIHVILTTLSLACTYTSTVAWSQTAGISGSGNICSVAIAGAGNKTTVSCVGVDPAIVERLIAANNLTSASNASLANEVTALVERFKELRDKLEQARVDNSATQRAWSALREGNLERADDIIATITAMAPSLKKIEANTDVTAMIGLIDRATSARNGAMQGQVQAVEQLLQNGSTFTGADLSGVALSKAHIEGANFSKAILHFTALDGAQAAGADFSNAGLRFADLSGADFSRAKMTKAYAPFLVANSGTSFRGSVIEHANFVAATLTGVDFSGADLRGSSFAFADLRGTVFENAELQGTQFVGAVLDGAHFNGAKFGETNVLGASAAGVELSGAQKSGTCRGPVGLKEGTDLELWLRVVEQSPSPRFESGFAYDHLVEERYVLHSFRDKSLPLCQPMAEEAVAYDSRFPYEISMDLKSAYFEKAGRRELFYQKVKEFVSLISERLTMKTVIRGPNTQIKEWMEAIRAASKYNITPIGPPELTNDQLLLLLIKHNIVKPDDIKWSDLAHRHFLFDEQLAKVPRESRVEIAAWSLFFPEGSKWEDLDDEVAGIFRTWTMSRADVIPDSLIYRPASQVVKDAASGHWFAKFDSPYLRPTFEGDTPVAGTVSNSLTPIIGDLKRTAFAPMRDGALGSKIHRVVLVFPKDYNTYRIPIIEPDELDDVRINPPIDVTLEVTRIEQLDKEPSTVLIFVEPGPVTLMGHGGVKRQVALLSG